MNGFFSIRAPGLGVGLVVALAVGIVAAGSPPAIEAQTLRGGAASLDRQNEQARLHDFSYLQTAGDVARMVELGYLVPVAPNADLEIHNVSFPYARPEVRVFLERLSSQYRAACGEKLVVTSLTRPNSHQPRNASVRSVHPTGMAVDLRRSGSAACRSWLETTLLSLESRRVIEAIYERNPPHYHVAVYPDPYIQYVAEITGNSRVVEQLAEAPSLEIDWVDHTVRGGETLTLIASRYGAAISRIQAENRISGTRINVGQVLRIPVYQTVPAAGVTRVASADQASGTPAEGTSPAAASSSGSAPATASAPGMSDSEGDEPAGGEFDATAPGPSAESASAAAPRSLNHRVVRGESLWTLSRRYGVSEADIRRANGLTGTRIQAGQTLEIPVGSASDHSNAAVIHEVRRGDSLWSIANLHGTTVDALRQANSLGSRSIQPGQVLEVPSGR